MNRAAQAIQRQKEQIERDQRDWSELEQLAKTNLAMFWSRYADYLQEAGAISSRRQFLIGVARRTAQRLE